MVSVLVEDLKLLSDTSLLITTFLFAYKGDDTVMLTCAAQSMSYAHKIFCLSVLAIVLLRR